MQSSLIRQKFLDFFASKQHKIVPSAPLVNKDDPTLMFINAGMNPFKDYFLGNKRTDTPRIADTQKCLRVSGKHNDLEEVGLDGYHHTLFEMMGNWSIGDYFKKEAIAWAWELLTQEYKLSPDRLYVTVFEGDEGDDLPLDTEAIEYWKEWISEDRILPASKKDNFWEMGDTGPCGPCSEIHIDLRSDEARAAVDGKTLVNQDDPEVIEIWNLVFIQFERRANGQLVPLADKHIDTGMGFERITMALQGKLSSYDTDLFAPLIAHVASETGYTYGGTPSKADMAFRVIVDHIRAVSFAIADGQLPSNTGAGYVIRRILRRAVRYYYSFLDRKTPLLYSLMEVLADQFKDVFPELAAQREMVGKVIKAEEDAFLNTLGSGIDKLNELMKKEASAESISGAAAFELYDTYGFPFDLTTLIAHENGFKVDEAGFNAALAAQKQRSKADATKQVGDWTVLQDDQEVTFVGYDTLEVAAAHVIKYRTVQTKKKDQYQVVLNTTPFYAEGGGQVGDTGWLHFGEERIPVIDTKKENDLIIHFVKKLPTAIDQPVKAIVNAQTRTLTECNHSATHLLHAALRQILGDHVQQKGSLVNKDYLRFDFSHYQKVTDEELAAIEAVVNAKIRSNIPLQEARSIPIEAAKAAGAMMLFGEKYGEAVRMITFDESYSRELCGGCHVPATGRIGLFKITAESSVAAGVRRIEAVTADAAEAYVNAELGTLNAVRTLFKNPKDITATIEKLQEENKALKKQVEKLNQLQAQLAKAELEQSAITLANGVLFVSGRVAVDSPDAIKNIAFDWRNSGQSMVFVVGAAIDDKANLTIAASDDLVARGVHAGQWVRELAAHIKGGGGGQPFFASAGGKDATGIEAAIAAARTKVAAL